MTKIDLVFRTVGERTSDLAFDLAVEQIQPDAVWKIAQVKPFSRAVQQMLSLNYQGDFVVFVDADCLILEDLRRAISEMSSPYTDCYVLDKFRGWIHCGVHIVSRNLVQVMRSIQVDPRDRKYVLRPESRIRDLALEKLGQNKRFQPFKIFHDYGQFYRDIFVKYALRELRSRTDYHRMKLNGLQQEWEKFPQDLDVRVANRGISYARKSLPLHATPEETSGFIEQLPRCAIAELHEYNLEEKSPMTVAEVTELSQQFSFKSSGDRPSGKIFGIGLSQTGTHRLATALNRLGYQVIHAPDDENTLKELESGHYQLSLLQQFDGMTDLPSALFFQELDRCFPHSRFILTLRPPQSWLQSLKSQWVTREIFPESQAPNAQNMDRRRWLKRLAFGSDDFNPEKFYEVGMAHQNRAIAYFKNRPDTLLILNLDEGDGWEKLCAFLNQPIPNQPFPN